MLNFDFAEVILVFLVAFLVVGPKDLPKVARWLGRTVRKARAFIEEFKKEIGWDAFTREIDDTAQDIKQTVKEADISSEIRNASKEVSHSFMDLKKNVQKLNDEANGTDIGIKK